MYNESGLQALEHARKAVEHIELPKVHAEPTAKWRLVSAMQKCIRRRNLDDLPTMIMGLHKADRAYMFRRMAVTALEDVGICLPEALMEALFIMQRAAARKEFADPHYDIGLAVALANLPKDRSMCDAMVGTAWNKAVPLPHDEKMHDPLHKDPLAYVRLGWWHLGALRLKHPRWTADRHEVQKFLQFLESVGIPDEDRQMSARILGAGFEGFGLTYAIMRQAAKHQLGSSPTIVEYKDDFMHPVTKVGAYPSYTFDVHTMEGKRAYAYFMAMKDVETVKRLDKIEDKDARWYAMDGVTFFGESDRMAQRIVWQTGIEARALSMRGCVPYPDYVEMVQQMEKDLPMLDYARKKVIKF